MLYCYFLVSCEAVSEMFALRKRTTNPILAETLKKAAEVKL